jgi:uncharacterized protein YccT (UPF0319 family)
MPPKATFEQREMAYRAHQALRLPTHPSEVGGTDETARPVPAMNVRDATAADVPGMHVIRLHVRENRLSDPSVVTERDYHDFMARDTKSWVCEIEGAIASFAMVDVQKQNLWALFVAPEQEFKGAGRQLHERMLAWYFGRADKLRLSTAPEHTR